MKIEKLDQRITNAEPTPISRVVLTEHTAYFTGHSAVAGADITQQTKMLCARYDQLLAQYGLKKEHIVYINAYLRDRKDIPGYEAVLKDWVGVETPPAGVAVQAPPMGDNNLLEMALIVARETPDMDLQKLDQRITNADPTPASRVVIHNGVAYFTGHSAFQGPDRETLAQQTRALLRRYDQLLEQFSLKKERILMYHAYLSNIDEIDAFAGEMRQWLGGENCPAAVAVQALPGGENNRLELSLLVAADDKPITRIPAGPDFSRLVIHNGVGYFTGHIARPTAPTYGQQMEIITQRYETFFREYGLNREDMILANIYVKDIGQQQAFQEPWADWAGYSTPPAGVAVEASPEQEQNLLEVEIWIAVDEKEK